MIRQDGRGLEDIRKISIEPNFIKWAEGSALVCLGDTKVICTASVLNNVPPFAKEKGIGWLFSEYSMLPRSVDTRTSRTQSGRSAELQRIIGRALRAICDLSLIREKTIIIDCDVIQADGGTRCASIIGGFVSLCFALYKMWKSKEIRVFPVKRLVSAISCGIVDGAKMVDLSYSEDSKAACDITVISTDKDEIIEVHGGVENGVPLLQKDFQELVDLGIQANRKIIEVEKRILGPILEEVSPSLSQ